MHARDTTAARACCRGWVGVQVRENALARGLYSSKMPIFAPMKAIVDDKIPYIQGQIERLVDEVVYMSGREIGARDVRDADVLIVRTRTRCDRTLLHDSRVRFIATATIGYDHLDVDYLRQAGIQWTNCPGCNATSVGQYVRNCLLLLQRERGIDLGHATLGIVGVGHVGRAVLQCTRDWVGRTLLNDPPRQHAECPSRLPADYFSSLDTLLSQCDIITIHTPLVRDGLWPTYHLFDERTLSRMHPGQVLINCGRGEVVDNRALEQALDHGQLSTAIIDTWEDEPAIRTSLLNKVYIGTPHIAGYSADGKANATRMSLQAVARWMGREMDFDVQPPSLPPTLQLSDDAAERALQLYDPRADSDRLRAHPTDFERQRGNYPLRRENA